jgi:hypothetical protein
VGFVAYSFSRDKNKIRQSNTAGKINGLQLELFSGYFDDMNVTDDSVIRYFRLDGFNVAVHNHSIDPRFYGGLLMDGIEISPGFSTNIIINRIFTSKLEEPFNNCIKNLDKTDSFDSDVYKIMVETRNYTYRQKDCFDYW